MRDLLHAVPAERRGYAWVYRNRPMRSARSRAAYRRKKRVLDIVLVLATAPAWLPAVAIGYLAVKLEDPGAPAIFTQSRTGLHGCRFKIYKLRTMVPEAESLLADFMHLNRRDALNIKLTHDPRITSIGHWLRRYYLDELPQVFNILAGHMSLVGPRPTTTTTDAFAAWQTGRLDQPPGLTCLWQIAQEQFPSFADRTRLDILYNRRCCLALDLQILTRTAVQLIRGGRGS